MGLTSKEYSGTLGKDGNVLILDCGNGYMSIHEF